MCCYKDWYQKVIVGYRVIKLAKILNKEDRIAESFHSYQNIYLNITYKNDVVGVVSLIPV